jgi:hypothetical protein
MQTAGARALREDDNGMSREAVLLQWERKIEAAERLEELSTEEPAEPPRLHAVKEERPQPRRFERAAEPAADDPPAAAPRPAGERRTITITGQPRQPTPPRRRRSVVEAQMAQPDRIALWAFLLGLLLMIVAAGTAHA